MHASGERVDVVVVLQVLDRVGEELREIGLRLLVGQGWSMNCDWPPAAERGDHHPPHDSVGSTGTAAERTRWRHASIPAAVPAEVNTSPWSTKRTEESTSTAG